MSRIKKILGLLSVIILFAGTILGIITYRLREGKLGFGLERSAKKTDFSVVNLGLVTEIETEQAQYVCLEDFLEMDENALVLEMYDNIKIVECMGVSCGAIF